MKIPHLWSRQKRLQSLWRTIKLPDNAAATMNSRNCPDRAMDRREDLFEFHCSISKVVARSCAAYSQTVLTSGTIPSLNREDANSIGHTMPGTSPVITLYHGAKRPLCPPPLSPLSPQFWGYTDVKGHVISGNRQSSPTWRTAVFRYGLEGHGDQS